MECRTNYERLTSSVELQSRLQSDSLLGSRRLCVGLLSSVESVDICLVVLCVVESHDLLGDEWLESIVGVGERREGVLSRHGGCGERRGAKVSYDLLYRPLSILRISSLDDRITRSTWMM